MRRLAPALAAVLVVPLLSVLSAAPAQAAGYRYWSFWDGGTGGPWKYASQGPSTARPADGEVLGFRFAVSQDAAAEAARPRAAADFAAVCGTTPAAEGRKRVALVIDFGVQADAPSGEAPPQAGPRTACAQVAPGATAAEALAAVAKPLRYDSAALLCAISGYPSQGCGDQVSDPGTSAGTSTSAGTGTGAGEPATTTPPPASAEPARADSGPSFGLLGGIAAVLALGAAAIWQSRRRHGR
ncbi:SCO2322 family protein [Streptomyces sp. NPDC012888]|uniref:SCO2322 family protein n=1 Tax=Streptomyces sp. NPDC012888 TaxID=3364855 RepID=UPI003693BDD5